jgi:hypothetical protein
MVDTKTTEEIEKALGRKIWIDTLMSKRPTDKVTDSEHSLCVASVEWKNEVD